MSNLVSVPKNGSLSNTNSNLNFPSWSSWIDDIFNRELPSVLTSNFSTGMTMPQVNIRETADAYFVDMAVPGMKKSDFNINLDNQLLSISTESSEEHTHENENFTRKEFGYSAFKRSFNLPETINENKIEAKYNDGILSIHLPKKEEAKQRPPRTIKVS
ncbi:Hsp20/alpha crystallin family protein [Winogradskyella vincentii]|uniref:Hsp20/alpha crystallin family protein n=1 Tax=Winogradskyella vincentii TaxID=2877122 RepID=A0ABS7Y1B5_9FLAO|nr:Hsp20/alpha crystallin family protein [Winogradskyella vincentii]MCA0153125.1 Hsp20/alpha crystallin family protein [Winogradskyella vincentii]